MNEDYGRFTVRSVKFIICLLMFSRHLYLSYLCYTSDALDSLNNKKAIQQADKILKKQKDLHCAKVQ